MKKPFFYNINCYHHKSIKMHQQFQKNLQRLKNRPKRYLVDVELKDRQYQLEVYQDTTLSKIVGRYKDNGYFDDNEQVTKVQVNKKQAARQSKIIDLMQGKMNQTINLKIRLISSKFSIQNSMYKSNVEVFEAKQSKDKQKMQTKQTKQVKQAKLTNQTNKNKEQIKLSTVQLQELIKKIQNQKQVQQIQQSHRKHFKIIKRLVDQMDFTITQKKKTIKYYTDFVNFLGNKIKVFKEQKRIAAQSQILKSSIMEKKLKLDPKQKNIAAQIENIMNSANNKSEDPLITAYNQHLLKILKQIKQNIKNSKQIKFQKFIQMYKNKQYQSVSKTSKQITQQIKSILQLIDSNKRKLQQISTGRQIQLKNLNDQLCIYSQKIKELQKNQQGFKNIKQIMIAKNLKSSYINNPEYQKQVQYLTETIQKYESYSIDCFESIFQFKKCQNINFELITNLLDQTYFSSSTRVLMVIGVQNQNITVYSTKGILKENSSQPIIKALQTQKTLPQKNCISGSGFLMLGNQLKKFQNKNKNETNSLVKYNKKILTIGNRFNILYSAKRKIQIQYKSSKEESQLEDDHNQLQNVLKNKKQEVLRLQIYKVNINFNQNQGYQKIQRSSFKKYLGESSFGGSTEATSSYYQKMQQSNYR